MSVSPTRLWAPWGDLEQWELLALISLCNLGVGGGHLGGNTKHISVISYLPGE